MVKFFITTDCIVRILEQEAGKNDKDRSNLYKILRSSDYCKICVGTIESKFQNIIFNFKQMHNLAFDITKVGYVDKLIEHPEMMLKEPNAVFILNISTELADSYSRKYGVLCFSIDNIHEGLLIDPNIEYSPYSSEQFGGWGYVLNNTRKLPSNALIIVDRYLFSSDNYNNTVGVNNVFEIMKSLLPEEFTNQTPYQVCVVFGCQLVRREMPFNVLAAKLEKKKNELAKEYEIDIELVGIHRASPFFEEIHNRRIISNYYIVRAEHQLGAFAYRKSTCSQTLTPQRLFTYFSLINHSHPPLRSIEQTSGVLRRLSENLENAIKGGLCYYAINGRYIGIDDCETEKNLMIHNRRIK